MKLIGGEIDYRCDGLYTYFTDSGRSSLRLILQSGLRDKKFLLPNYLCKIIPIVFDQLGVNYSYYEVAPDLSINIADIQKRKFDVLYFIDYFGNRQSVYEIQLTKDVWFLEDCVFSPVVDPPAFVPNWIGFNSFRKISHLADGSIIKSSIELAEELINVSEPSFSQLKYRAKRMKYEYLHDGRFTEEEYLQLFNQGERSIDAQKEIFPVSRRSLANLLEFYRNIGKEYEVRANNYRVLDKLISHFKVGLNTEYYTLYPLSVDRRDELRNHLFSQRIFLPVHWPRIAGLENILYDRTISIPVDSRYDESDMIRVANAINLFYGRT